MFSTPKREKRKSSWPDINRQAALDLVDQISLFTAESGSWKHWALAREGIALGSIVHDRVPYTYASGSTETLLKLITYHKRVLYGIQEVQT